MRLDRLHADDTPVRVLDPERRPAQGKTRGVKEESWLWKSEHRDKWSFCLKAASMRAAQEQQ